MPVMPPLGRKVMEKVFAGPLAIRESPSLNAGL